MTAAWARGMRPLAGVLVALCACAGAGHGIARAETLRVFAASSLTDAFREAVPAFETAHPGVRVEFHFAGTATLRAQIEHGARSDVIAAADTVHPAALRAQHLVLAPRVFARNRLVVALRPGAIGPADPSDATAVLRRLGEPGLRIVLAHEAVPAGRYARAALDRMSADAAFGNGFRAAVEKNVLSHETNVRAVLAKVILGEADAGFVYASDVPAAESRLVRVEIPEPWNVIAPYAAAVVTASPRHDLAESFVAWLSSEAARAALLRHGFEP